MVADHIWYSRPGNGEKTPEVTDRDGRNPEKFEKERKDRETGRADQNKEREEEKLKKEEKALTL